MPISLQRCNHKLAKPPGIVIRLVTVQYHSFGDPASWKGQALLRSQLNLKAQMSSQSETRKISVYLGAGHWLSGGQHSFRLTQGRWPAHRKGGDFYPLHSVSFMKLGRRGGRSPAAIRSCALHLHCCSVRLWCQDIPAALSSLQHMSLWGITIS